MIWSDRDIFDGIQTGEIGIDPFLPDAIQPASVDLKLGNLFFGFIDVTPGLIIDTKQNIKDLMYRVESEEIIIRPHQFLLGCTQEKVSLGNSVVARVEGKSSLGRIGLSVHTTAGFIDPGNRDLRITLELFNHSPLPIKLYSGMWIAQIAFESLKNTCVVPYGPDRGSRYFADQETVPSKVNENHGQK